MLLHVFARFCNSDSYLALIICIAVAVVVGFCFVRRFIQLFASQTVECRRSDARSRAVVRIPLLNSRKSAQERKIEGGGVMFGVLICPAQVKVCAHSKDRTYVNY